MKKIINSICMVAIISFIFLGCSHFVAKSFFNENLKLNIIKEVDIKGYINGAFNQLKESIPYIDTTEISSIQEEIVNNDKIDKMILLAGDNMLEDIVNKEKENQDMNALVKDVVISYDHQFQEILSPYFTIEQVDAMLIELCDSLPIQQFYNDSVEVFRQQIPSSYITGYKIAENIANNMTLYICVGGLLISVLILCIIGLQYAAWAFPMSIATLFSGCCLLLAGIIMPMIYNATIQKFGHAIAQAIQMDFTLLTSIGFACLFIGMLCMMIHIKVTRKYMSE